MVIPILLTGGLAALALGLAMLAMGWRGRRVDTHPICRRCRFDLFGLPAEQSNCPECGAHLRRRRATRLGNRRRRPSLVVGGLLLFLTGGTLVCLDGWSRASQFDWNTIKPTWMLVMEIERRDPATVQPMLDEIIVRIDDEQLSDGRLHRLLMRGLAVQGDRGGPWLDEWGDLIEAISEFAVFTDEHLLRYVRQGLDLEMRLRETVVKGEPTMVELTFRPVRFGSRLSPHLHMMSDEIRIGDRVMRQGGSRSSVVMTSRTTSASLGSTVRIDAEAGTHTFEGQWTIVAGLRPSRPGGDGIADGPRWTFRDSREIRVLPPGETLVTVRDDEHLRREMMQVMQIDPITVSRRGDRRASVTGMVRLSELPPVSMAAQVFLRSGEREWSAGGLTIDADGGLASFSFGDILDDFEADRVDVVLRADAVLAERHPQITEILGGEIVIPDVPVLRSD